MEQKIMEALEKRIHELRNRIKPTTETFLRQLIEIQISEIYVIKAMISVEFSKELYESLK